MYIFNNYAHIIYYVLYYLLYPIWLLKHFEFLFNIFFPQFNSIFFDRKLIHGLRILAIFCILALLISNIRFEYYSPDFVP
jgi:hypothetical protein